MKKRLTAFLVLCMLFCMHGAVFAVQSEPLAAQPDLMRDGSITVHLDTVNETPVTDGYAELLLVSSLLNGPNGAYFEPNAAFGTLPFDPVAVLDEPDTPKTLAELAKQNGVPYTEAPFVQGVAKFATVAPGLYLVMQDGSSETYTTMQPALVLVPEMRDGTYIYDVDCYPKPVTERGAIEIEIEAEKKIINRGGATPADTEFSFILTPGTAEQPMPKTENSQVDPRSGAAVVSRKGAGVVSFGVLSLGKQDIGKTYRYTIHEVKGTAQYFTYDVSVFTLTVAVTDSGNGEPKASVTLTDENGKSADRAVFTNIYAPPEKPEIPRTGQLWWPVVVLAFFGFLLLILGFGRRRSARED